MLLVSPVFVTDYPQSLKPFYMRRSDSGGESDPIKSDPKATVACMDLLVPSIGELIGGSEREERYDVLKHQLLSHKLSLEQYNWYLELRQYGTVRHGGWGMGFERYLMFLTGLNNLRDVIPVPRAPMSHTKF